MKKFYSFAVAVIMSVLGFVGFAQLNEAEGGEAPAAVEEGVLYVDAQLYHFSASSAENNRIEPIDLANGEYKGEYSFFSFQADQNPFDLKGQNEGNKFFVYLNNEQVECSEEGQMHQMFEAQVTFAANDVLKVYDHEPFTTNVEIGFRTFVAPNVLVTMDKVNTVDAWDTPFTVLEGTEFQLKAGEGEKITAVYVNNEEIEAVDGVYTFNANVEGDMLVIVDVAEQVTGAAYFNGSFFYVTAQSQANNRVEAFAAYEVETAGEYVDYAAFTNDNPFDVIAINADNKYFVYYNDEAVANLAETADQPFRGTVEFAQDGVLKVYDHEPFTANVAIDATDAVSIVMDKVVAVSAGQYTVLEGTTFDITPAAGALVENVYANGEAVEAVDGVYTVVAAAEGDLNITVGLAEICEGIYYVDGTFNIISVASDSNPRIEPIEVKEGEYDGVYTHFAFRMSQNPFVVRAWNEAGSYYVYINEEAVVNEAISAENPFLANIELADNDVVKFFDHEPYVSNVAIGFMQPNSEVYNQVVVTKDEIVTVEGLDDPDCAVKALEGTKFTIKATAGNKIANVYVCNEDVEANEAGEYVFYADRAGDMLAIIDMEGHSQAVAYVQGQFGNVVAQSVADNRIEAFGFAGPYAGDYKVFDVLPSNNPFAIKAQNEGNNIYVYQNNKEVANSEIGELAEMFMADVTIHANDVFKIYDRKPFVTNMIIGFMQPNEQVAHQVEVVMDEIIPVEGLEALETAKYDVLEGTQFKIKAADGYFISNVYYCNEDVEPVDGVYTVTADREGDALIIIDMAEIADAVAYINGNFNLFTAQSAANNRIEPFFFEQGEYDGLYRVFGFRTSQNPFDIKGHNNENSYYVYLNNEEVANSEDGVMHEMFEAQVNLQGNDVIKAYDHKPYVTNMIIGFMQPNEQVAHMVDVVMDEIVPVKGLESLETAYYDVLEGTQFKIKAVEGYQIANVYYCNDDVYPVDGVYTVTADRAGDALIIIDMVEEAEAVVYIQGEFYSFVAQAEANNRIEPINFTQGSYCEYDVFTFAPANNPFYLKGVASDVHVYLNDNEIDNTEVGELAEMYIASANFQANDVLKVYNKLPFWSLVEFGFTTDRAEASEHVAIVMDKIIPVEGLEDAETAVFDVLEGTQFEIQAVEGYQVESVWVNDTNIEGDGTGKFVVAANAEGELFVTIDVKPTTGIAAIAADSTDNNVYNLQGIMVVKNANADQISNLPAGIYVVNGKKVLVR